MRLPNLRKASRPAPRPKHRPVCVQWLARETQCAGKLAAEELIDQWTVQFLSGQNGKPDPHRFKTVEQAIEDYLAEKRGTLNAHKESTKLTIQKIAGIFRPLAPFLRDRGIIHLKDVKTEHLSVFQETWQGRLRNNRESDGKLVRQPKSQLGKQKNQEFVKMFFRRARELRWIRRIPPSCCLRSRRRGLK